MLAYDVEIVLEGRVIASMDLLADAPRSEHFAIPSDAVAALRHVIVLERGRQRFALTVDALVRVVYGA